MKLSPNTFCSAPWFQIRADNDGKYRSCCVIDHTKTQYHGQTEYNVHEHSSKQWIDSGYNQYLKQHLTHGKKLPECHKCWENEDHNQLSQRQVINRTLTKNSTDIEKTWISSYLRRKIDYGSNLLLAADVKISNLCNFACAMCNPMDSSKIYKIWKKEQNHPLVQMKLEKDVDYLERVRSIHFERNNSQLLKEILEQSPRYLKILGGEPLLDKDLCDILGAIEKQQAQKINLVIITNGSQDLVKAQSDLSNYHSVSFVVSLEGINEVQDYIRRGSVWSKIESNIDRYLDRYGSDNIYINHTLQALSITRVSDLFKWCHDRGICVSVNALHDPLYLSLAVVPDDVLQQVVNDLSTLDISIIKPWYTDVSHLEINGLTKFISKQKFDKCAFDYFVQFMRWYDPESNWIDIFPEWRPWLCANKSGER